MTAHYLYSNAKVQEALAAIGESRTAETPVGLVRQIIKAQCYVKGVTVTEALGGEELASDIVSLLKQLVVVIAS